VSFVPRIASQSVISADASCSSRSLPCLSEGRLKALSECWVLAGSLWGEATLVFAAGQAYHEMEDVREQVRVLVQGLLHSEPSIAAAAAESLFDLGVRGGYASEVATHNRMEIGQTDGVFEGFAHLVTSGTDEGQGWACAALAQIAFDNTTNCISVVRTPGMLSGLRRVMERSSKDSKAAAALAVNNISAFSEQASAIIVQADVLNINRASASSLAHLLPFLSLAQCQAIEQGRQKNGAYKSWEDIERVDHTIDKTQLEQLRSSRRPNLVLTDEPGLLDALKILCRAEHTDARTDAVGAVNHISRCDQARPILIAHNIVYDALAPALMAKYEGNEELDAIVARATMAMANIMAHPTNVTVSDSSNGNLDCGATASRPSGHGAFYAGGAAAEVALEGGVEASSFAGLQMAAAAPGVGLVGVGVGHTSSQDASAALRRPISEYIAICRVDGEGCMHLREAALGILVRCLQYALEGKKWVGITWGIFSVVHALRNLSENVANKRVLTSWGLVQLLGVSTPPLPSPLPLQLARGGEAQRADATARPPHKIHPCGMT